MIYLSKVSRVMCIVAGFQTLISGPKVEHSAFLGLLPLLLLVEAVFAGKLGLSNSIWKGGM